MVYNTFLISGVENPTWDFGEVVFCLDNKFCNHQVRGYGFRGIDNIIREIIEHCVRKEGIIINGL